VDKLYWMNGSHRKSGRLLVSVVQFVEVFVEERRVVDAMVPVRQIILKAITSILLFVQWTNIKKNN
jgi:hypothetical protein